MVTACWDRSLNTRKVLLNVAPDVSNVIAEIEKGASCVEATNLRLNSQAAAILGRVLLGSNVTNLTISGCNIGDAGCIHIGRALLSERKLQWLNLSNNNLMILPKDFTKGVAAGGITGLNLGHNPLTRSSIDNLCTEIQHSPQSTIYDIDLSNTGSLYCSDSLSRISTKVSTMRIGHNASWVATDLPFQSVDAVTITTVDFSYSKIGETELELVSKTFGLLHSLERFNLKGNSITPTGLVILSEGLKCTKSLKELSLSLNPLTGVNLCSDGSRTGFYNEKGLLALSSSISHNRGLQKLDLSSCLLGYGTNKFYDGSDHGGVTLLADTVKLNVSMQVFYLCDNHFNNLTMKTVRRVSGGKVSFTPPDSPIGVVESPSSPIDPNN
eukprot:TRINITY_DN15640_c0_g1_i1.p1 TRINITY_DN15640_c0_g1~~TRINITY_DN15640_c0_g1_i1.p1  ORF type:complete len:383 (+),score=58.30 TRINITY_DN15640_c0_g1_i1:106-1254(+)